jgi:hypothetical protein
VATYLRALLQGQAREILTETLDDSSTYPMLSEERLAVDVVALLTSGAEPEAGRGFVQGGSDVQLAPGEVAEHGLIHAGT